MSVLLLVIDLKHFYALSVLPAVLCMLSFIVIFAIQPLQGNALQVVYRNDGKNDGIMLVRGREAMICDLSNGSATQLRADWREAQKIGATELSELLLTHYHSKSAVAVSRFTQSVILRELWLPQPADEAERDICADLLVVAIKRNVQVTLYDAGSSLTVFDIGKLEFSERLYRSRSVEPVFSMRLSYGKDALCYHSASYEEYLASYEIEHVCTASQLILGAHGPVPQKDAVIRCASARCVVVGNKEHLIFYQLDTKGERVLAPSCYRYVFP